MSTLLVKRSDPQSDPEAASLVELLRSRAAGQADQRAYTFLVDGKAQGACLTYGELDRRARAIAAWLQSAGACDERVLLLFPPGLDYIAAFFGALYAKAIAVPAYPPRMNRNFDRLEAIIADARPAVALTTNRILPQIEPMFEHAQLLKSVQWQTADDLPDGLAQEWREPLVEGETLAFLQYTSGSTAKPKGVMVSHENLLHNERMIKRAFQQTADSVIVGWLPLFHDMGLIGNVLQPLYLGAHCILQAPVTFLQSPFTWLEAISHYAGTTSGGPNFAYDLCARKVSDEQRETLDLSSWTVAFSGSEPVRKETLDRFAAAFAPCGFRKEAFYACYGLAEATLFVTGGLKMAGPKVLPVGQQALQKNQATVVRDASDHADEARYMVGCGHAWLEQKVVIVDPESSAKCPDGQIGEIWVGGSSIAQGYWDRPEESAQVFGAYLADPCEGPFLRTGDLGFLHDGELFITGRLKDLIIIRGRNHYPQDIEQTVERSYTGLHAGNGAAFSIEVDGEERLVVVQEIGRRYQHNNLEAAIRAIRQAVAEEHELQLYAAAIIKQGTIPKTSSGKIQRGAAKQLFQGGLLETVCQWQLDQSAEASESDLVAAGPLDNLEAIQAWMASEVAARTGHKRSAIDINAPISCYGVDSLMDVEMVHSVEVNLGVSLPLATFLQDASIRELAAHVRDQLEHGAALSKPKAAAGTRQSELPLSRGQAALWFIHQLAAESAAYNVPVAVRVLSPLDTAVLRRAFQALSDRHPSLRTRFAYGAGAPVQIIEQEREVCFHREDASDWTADQINERVSEEAQRPFDLENGPVFRVFLFSISAKEHVLLLVAHHMVVDLWSLAVLAKELSALYEAELSRADADLPALRFSYADYALWQEELLAGPAGDELLSYWQEQLAGELPILEMPTDHPRPPVQTYTGAAETLSLSRELSDRLMSIARSEGVTLYVVLLAAYQSLLHRYTGQEDLLVGSPTTGRTHAEFEPLVGYFVNPVVIRAKVSGEESFRRLLLQMRQTALGAFKHQHYPFALLVDRLKLDRDPSRSPLFQAAFILQKVPKLGDQSLIAFALSQAGSRMRLGSLALESLHLDQQRAHFDLTLAMGETEAGLVGSLLYNTSLFEPMTMRRMAEHFTNLLESIAATPDETIARLNILSAAERMQLLQEWNDTRVDYQSRSGLHELIAEQAARTPDAVAVVCQHQHLSYRELNRRADQLADYLASRAVTTESRVGLYMERSPEMIVGMLGVLKAGGAYVPMDAGHPAERLAYMIEDSEAVLVLTERRLSRNLPQSATGVICLDSDWHCIEQESAAAIRPETDARNLVYVIYTSGSTGQPKGVGVEHRQIINYSLSMSEKMRAVAGARYAMVSTLAADLGNTVIFPSLITGGCLHVIPQEMTLDAGALADYFKDNHIEYLKIVPSHLAGLQAASRDGMLMPTKTLVLGGEASSAKWVRQIQNQWPECTIINHYGPTETTVGALTCAVRADLCADAEAETIPIGHPIANASAYVLDRQLSLVPRGVSGELHIGGAGVSRGYINRPAATAERFIPDAFSNQAGSRLYRTGDRARHRSDGAAEFLGRSDDQVKIRGFRIELGEIEAALTQHSDVRKAAVLMREDSSHVKRLVAYVEPACERGLEVEALQSFLSRRLPDYMVPSIFISVDELPLMPNGKLDRRSLPVPDFQGAAQDGHAVLARTELEQQLSDIWCQVLGLERVGVHDNFFRLGGDSILSIQIVSRARQAGYRLTAKDVLQHQTIAELAAVIDTDRIFKAEQSLVQGEVPLTPIQHMFFEQDFADPHHWNQALLLQTMPGTSARYLATVLSHLLCHHDALRLRFVQDGSSWRQEIVVPAEVVPFVQLDLSALPGPQQAQALERAVAASQASLNFTKGPLLRMALFTFGPDEPGRLLIIIHHLAVDGVSWRVLMEDMQTAYLQLCQRSALQLPAKTTSYQQWANGLVKYAQSAELARQAQYWLALDGASINRLPADHTNGANSEASARTVLCALDQEETAALLREVPAAYQTQIEDVLLTALVQAFAQCTGSPTLLIALEGHGREELIEGLDLSRTVGWFTAIFPLLLSLGESDEPGAALKQVKEQLRAIPQRGVGYGLLRYLSGDAEVARKLRALPRPQLSFNYLGQFDQVFSGSSPFELAGESSGPRISPRASRRYLFDITAQVTGKQLQVFWRYSENIHRRDTVERLAQDFMAALRSIIAHCLTSKMGGYTPSDFPEAHLSQQELDDLIAEFGQAVE